MGLGWKVLKKNEYRHLVEEGWTMLLPRNIDVDNLPKEGDKIDMFFLGNVVSVRVDIIADSIIIEGRKDLKVSFPFKNMKENPD